MTMESTASLEVVRFCLGSAAYRRNKKQAFLGAVADLPGESLRTLLGKAHLTGLFASLVERGDLRSPPVQTAMTLLTPMLRARAIFDRNILAELLNFGAKLAAVDSRIYPVVLKGMSYWHVYYDEPMARRVRDLDLLVEDPDQADIVCDVLEQEGYEALFFVDDERTLREHFRAGESYSVPPLRIRRRADLEGEDFPDLHAVIERYGSDTGLELVDADGPIFTVDVELHKALFASLNGAFVSSDPSYYRRSEILPQFRELTPAAALAYTGVKLALDILDTLAAGAVNFKCLKLAADFVRILLRCTQAEFTAALTLVRAWHCLPHFIDSLQAIRPLAPEINLHGLPPPDGNDSLDLLLQDVLAEFTADALCLA